VKVIGAGFGRTGTLSLKEALEQLGLGPCYHMLELIDKPERAPLWQAAAEGRDVDWGEVLSGYEATVDWPGCNFYRQLMAAYPEAKVVLTVRDPDAWYESTKGSIYAATVAGRKGELPGGDRPPPPPEVMRVIGAIVWGGSFQERFEDRDYAIEVFNRHNEEVRATVPADRLLVHEIKDGWEPLTDFFGLPVPDAPFPRVNDTAAFRDMVGLPAL
jgi:hypothetical protein